MLQTSEAGADQTTHNCCCCNERSRNTQQPATSWCGVSRLQRRLRLRIVRIVDRSLTRNDQLWLSRRVVDGQSAPRACPSSVDLRLSSLCLCSASGCTAFLTSARDPRRRAHNSPRARSRSNVSQSAGTRGSGVPLVHRKGSATQSRLHDRVPNQL